ncbi:MAG: hypothetical protein HKO81_02395 [Flavobacteriaceae bacterium]|nr:hypothetical protein [Croceitalea sp.]NNC33845.1 hypothetical protein [Croceitalea sp.]NNL15475.1 hypothetical protein [Flavobacteriaceae bacterium]NNM18978.1 hypothetical protein [Croceitalea sp.]
MNKKYEVEPRSFLIDQDNKLNYSALFKLNLYLNALDTHKKPYTIDYNTLLLSYHMWKGKNVEEFCEKQTISHFLFNPQNDSAEAREAFYMDIREFLLGN